MHITNPVDFIHLGARIRYLIGVQAKYPLDGRGNVLDNLTKLRERLVALGFNVSVTLFDGTLADFVAEFKQKIAKQQEGEATLADSAAKFTDQVTSFEKTVTAEAVNRKIAIPMPRRIPLQHLLERPENVFGKGVFDALTDIAKRDVRESCSCIAFEVPTAAAFHILRCVEECVRIVYRTYFPRKTVQKRTWGQLTSELKQKPRNPRPDQTLLAHLDHVREKFRNPTDHPDKFYDIEEVEDLLHLAADIINRCVKDKQVAKRTARTP
jgi:hypothetical protein